MGHKVTLAGACAGLSVLSAAAVPAGAVTLFDLDGSALPAPITNTGDPGTWSLINNNAATPGYVPAYFGPSSGTPEQRGLNEAVPFTAGDGVDARANEEAQSELTPPGNQALFVNMNNRSGQGGNKNDFTFHAGSDAASPGAMTLSSRFKVDWVNNAFNGVGILALQPDNGPGIALAISDLGQNDTYEVLVLQYRGGPGPGGEPFEQLDLANIPLDADPGNPNAQESAGYFTAQLYVNPDDDSARVVITDETGGRPVFDQTFTNLTPSSGGSDASFGAGLNEVTRGNGAELKMIYDYVRLETGNTIPEPAGLPALGLALAAGLAARRRCRA